MDVNKLKLEINELVNNPKATKIQLSTKLKEVGDELELIELEFKKIDKPIIKPGPIKEKPGKVPTPKPVTHWY